MQNKKHEPCSENCYLLHRDPIFPLLTTKEQNTLNKINTSFQPSPCLSFLALRYIHKTNVTCSQLKNITDTYKTKQQIYKKEPTAVNINHDIDVHYNPCSHLGSCNKNKNCSCFTNSTYCEISCGCEACDMIFEGCNCEVCGTRCKCRIASRECTFLCHKKKQIDCGNKGILLNKGANTFVGESIIAGYGLFAAMDISKNSFVIEYVGEVISHNEAERRGFFYDHKKISYLFDLSLRDDEDYGTIDATRIGNNARFINHSKNANLDARQMIVNGILRMGMYAKRDIKENEELFFDYKYNENIKKIFNLKD
ncbi:hypothetical protein COBT_002046 [Conglomerata obtusa]